MSVNIPYTEHVGKLIFGCVPFPSIFATFGKSKKSCIEPTPSTESSEWWFGNGIPLISGKFMLVKYYNLGQISWPQKHIMV